MTDPNASPTILGPGEGRKLRGAGVELTFKSEGGNPEAWSVMEYVAPPHFRGPPPHYHKVTTEAFYILEGVVTFTVEGEKRQAEAGSYLMVPPGVRHGFANETDAPARFLGLIAPSGFERYFDELVELIKGEASWPPADMSGVLALMERYDTFVN